MSTQQVRKTNASRRHFSPSSYVNVGDSTLTLPLLMFISFLLGVCVTGTIAFGYVALRADRRADLLQLEVESFKNILHAQRLPSAAHLPGESP